MPRKPRLHFPGAVYHVMMRGNQGQDVFIDPADRIRFYLLLQSGIERFGHRIHAFCLMTNHVHLAVQVGATPLARIMQNLGFRYTQYFNRRHQKTGHLFQGRYKALLVEADSYLLELVRYIHLNPVRAGMVARPEDHPWSGHNAYLGAEGIPWLTTDWVFAQWAPTKGAARRHYRQFVDAGLDEGYRADFHQGSFEGRALGDDRFIEAALTRSEEDIQPAPTLDAIIAGVCSVCQLTREEISSRSRIRATSEARAMIALLVRETKGLKLADLSQYLNQDISSLSQAARRLVLRLSEDADFRLRFDEVKGNIPNCQA